MDAEKTSQVMVRHPTATLLETLRIKAQGQGGGRGSARQRMAVKCEGPTEARRGWGEYEGRKAGTRQEATLPQGAQDGLSLKHQQVTLAPLLLGQTLFAGGSSKATAPHSSPLAWKIPWMEEPGGLQSMGSLRVGHD